MNEELKEELRDCDTLNEMWTTLNEYYNLDTELGTITKGVVVVAFIKNMDRLVKVTRTPDR